MTNTLVRQDASCLHQYPNFGAWVKVCRKGLRLTQSQLARKASCGLDTLRAIEQNKPSYRPSEQVVKKLAEALEILREDYPAFLALARQRARTTQLPPAAKAPLAMLAAKTFAQNLISKDLLTPKLARATTGRPGGDQQIWVGIAMILGLMLGLGIGISVTKQ